MLAYVVRRLLLLVPVLVGVSMVSFALLQLVPGDPALILAGEEATEEVLTRIRQEYGLNRPLPVQFLAYLRRVDPVTPARVDAAQAALPLHTQAGLSGHPRLGHPRGHRRHRRRHQPQFAARHRGASGLSRGHLP